MTSSRIVAYLFLAVSAAIWGLAVPVIKVTLESYPPILFLFYRFFLTSMLLIPLLLLFEKKILPKNLKDASLIILSGLLGATVALGLLFWGLHYTTSLSASILSSLAPLLVVTISIREFREKVTRQEKLGLAITLVGALTLSLSPALLQNLGSVLGNLIVLISNLAVVGNIILNKKLLKLDYSPLFLTAWMFFVGFLSLIPIALWQYQSATGLIAQITSQPFSAHMGVWYMAFASGALAYFLYNEAQRRIEASEAVIFYYLIPLATAPFAIFWLGEKLTPVFLLGAAIITAGVFIAEYKRRRASQP